MPTQPPPQRTAIIYTRTSTKAQKSGHDAQEAQCRQWAHTHHITIRATYADTCSGITQPTDRPGLMSALRDLKKGELLITYKRDRIGRDLKTNLLISTLIHKRGGELIATDMGEQDGPEGELLTHLLDAIATYERAIIRLRTQASIEVRRRDNKPLGPAPIGQKIENQTLTHDPDETEKITRVQQYRRAGLSLRQILRRCAQEGITTRRGAPPSLTTIARWCRDPSPP